MKRTRKATLDETVRAWPATFVACRTYGHAWAPHAGTHHRKSHVWEVTTRCSRCETLRDQWWNERGDVLRSTYRYVSGYLAPGVNASSAEGRARVRVAAMTSVVGHVGVAND